MKMHVYLTVAALIMITYSHCGKDGPPTVALNATESKLKGTWLTKRITYERPGQAPVVSAGNFPDCSITFKDQPFPHANSGIFANTKWADDKKDCNNRLNAWKVDENGKLFLGTLPDDTVYAEILILRKDTLAFRATSQDFRDERVTYEFR